jgi:diguanylate cyclase (GGDEF)-like protein
VIQCNFRDISERKRAQDALVKSEATLRKESVRDHLTGLFNRRYLDETLQRELDRALRKQLSLGLIMLDTDNLKRFNDSWGHSAGDGVLQELGALLLGQFHNKDFPCRYGGDEFVIIMPDATLKTTYERAETLREYAKKHSHIIDGQVYPSVSLSFGVAAFPQHGSTSEGLMHAVDRALYQAKHQGRGCIVIAY